MTADYLDLSVLGTVQTLAMGILERDKEIVRLRGRLRITAQTLIGEIGASGPQNAEEAATRSVEEIKRLKARSPSNHVNTDCEGRPVPDDEDLDTIIKVWEVDPHPQTRRCDVMVERSWQNMLEIVRSNLDSMLERFIDDGDTEVKMTFRIVSMPKRDYLEMIEELAS